MPVYDVHTVRSDGDTSARARDLARLPWRRRVWQLFLEHGLGAPHDVSVFLGDVPQVGGLANRIETRALWEREGFGRRLTSLLRGRWQPRPEVARNLAEQNWLEEVFGGWEDWGELLIALNEAFFSAPHDLSALTEHDTQRAHSLTSFSEITRQAYRGLYSQPPLGLGLRHAHPMVGTLLLPMMAKVPIISCRYFLQINPHYVFDCIRRTNHPEQDHLIAHLYDLLLIQQKTALQIRDFVAAAAGSSGRSGSADLTNFESDAIRAADGAFPYLRASVEKTVALLALTFEVQGVDSKKEHKKRLALLRSKLPKDLDQLFYASFLLDFISTEALVDLDAYRTGLLHKKGIATLQPHSYVSRGVTDMPYMPLFASLMDQHTRNTAGLIYALALLTDDLVKRDAPVAFERILTARVCAQMDLLMSDFADADDSHPPDAQ